MEGPNISIGARSTAKVPFFVCVSKKKKKDAGEEKDAEKKDGGKEDAEGRRDKLCLTDIFSRGNFQLFE